MVAIGLAPQTSENTPHSVQAIVQIRIKLI